MSDHTTTPDIETLKAQHLNQALAFVEASLTRPLTEAEQAETERRAAEWHDRLLEKRHEWQGREGASFVLPIINARTARQQSEAVCDAMHAAYLAGALAAEELGREGK